MDDNFLNGGIFGLLGRPPALADSFVQPGLTGLLSTMNLGMPHMGILGVPSPLEIAGGAKPAIPQSHGGVSTEKTVTIEADGRHFVIPTIVNGVSYTPEAAIQGFMGRKIKPIADFGSAAEANAFAENRSRELDKAFGGGGRLMTGESSPMGGMLRKTFP